MINDYRFQQCSSLKFWRHVYYRITTPSNHWNSNTSAIKMRIKNPFTVSYHFSIPGTVTEDARGRFEQKTLVFLFQ